MLNYIKSEFYRNSHRKYFILITGLTSLFLLGLNIFMFGVGIQKGVGLIDFMVACVRDFGMITPLVLILFIVDMVSADECKNGTLKNTIAFGMTRVKLAICKFVVISALFFLAMFIILFTLLGSSLIFFGPGKHFTWNIVFKCIFRWCAAVPLWISAILTGMFFVSIVNKAAGFIYLYIAAFVGLPILILTICDFLQDNFIEKLIMPPSVTLMLAMISEKEIGINDNTILAEIIAVIYIVLFSVLTLVFFSKKDIK